MNSTHTPEASSARLPELTPERIRAIEDAVFADISAEHVIARTRRARRGRVWAGAGAAAAVVIVAAVLAPTIARVVSPSAEDPSAGSSVVAPAIGSTEMGEGFSSQDGSSDTGRSFAGDPAAPSAELPGAVDAARDIVTTGSATLVVDDVADAVSRVAAAASAVGGYVETSTVGESGAVSPAAGGPAVGDMPYPYPGPVAGSAWISVRVPSERLTEVMDAVSEIGEVTASSVSRTDVTAQAVDLRARIEAAQTSVARLTELMTQAMSTTDLIAAESALAERQATLESYQQQLTSIESQVDLSSLSVSLQPRTVAVTADPAGFGDGLSAGWNGLIATLNGLVVALGFLLPWFAVAAVVGILVWVIVRAVRASRARRSASDAG